MNRQDGLWPGIEFFAFSGLRLGRRAGAALGRYSLPSRLAACDGAPVALQQSRPPFHPALASIP